MQLQLKYCQKNPGTEVFPEIFLFWATHRHHLVHVSHQAELCHSVIDHHSLGLCVRGLFLLLTILPKKGHGSVVFGALQLQDMR